MSEQHWKSLPALSTPGTSKIDANFWEYFVEGDTVCEVGTGTGRVIDECLARRLKVLGIDINQQELHELKLKYENNKSVRLVEHDITESAIDVKVSGALALGLLGALVGAGSRRHALANIRQSCKAPGIVSVAEFKYDEMDPVLQERYKEGQAAGLEPGSFFVKSNSGETLYETHNFRLNELIDLVEIDFDLISVAEQKFKSYHGNDRQGILILAKARGI